MSLLMFCLQDLFVSDRGVCKSSIVIMDLSISPCSAVFASHILKLCCLAFTH